LHLCVKSGSANCPKAGLPQKRLWEASLAAQNWKAMSGCIATRMRCEAVPSLDQLIPPSEQSDNPDTGGEIGELVAASSSHC
jgi:hypothetical protein